MSLIDKMLADKTDKVTEKPKKDYEIKRFSQIYGEPFLVELRALDTELFSEITDSSVKYSRKGRVEGVDSYKSGVKIVINGTFDKESGEELFKNKALLTHFKVATPEDLANKLLLPGEMGDIARVITELSGANTEDDTNEIVKN